MWRWHNGSQWLPDWYINLELPWVRTSVGFDSQDWTLDIIAARDTEGGWSVRFKDEDELAFYAAEGIVSKAGRALIERAGEEAIAAVYAELFPFDSDLASWIPETNWPAPQMPAGWTAVR